MCSGKIIPFVSIKTSVIRDSLHALLQRLGMSNSHEFNNVRISKARVPGQHSKPWSPGRAFVWGVMVTASRCLPYHHPPAAPSCPFRIHLPTGGLEGVVLILNALVRIRYQRNCIGVLHGSASACPVLGSYFLIQQGPFNTEIRPWADQRIC